MIYSENIFLCIAMPLLVCLPLLGRNSRRFCIAFLGGMFMCLLGAYLNSFFSELFEMNEMETARYISPIVEEIMRMIPISVYLLLYQPREYDFISFSVVVGVGFATFENCIYLIQKGSGSLQFIFVRGLAVGVLHVVCGLIIGIVFSLGRKKQGILVTGAIAAFSFSMTIHALYNLLVSEDGISTYIGFCVPMFVLGMVRLMWSRSRLREKKENS